MASKAASQDRISDDEAAVLRSWLAGHNLADIARARGTTAEALFRIVSGLCNLDRPTGREILRTGIRRKPRRPAPMPAPFATPAPPKSPAAADDDQDRAPAPEPAAPAPAAEPARLDHPAAVTAVVDAARALNTALLREDVTWYRAPWGEMTDLMRAVAALDNTAPTTPLVDVDPAQAYPAWACTRCPYIGPDDDHGDDHPGGADLDRVVVVIARAPEVS